uniref:Beta-glucosidase BglX n=1 Tax=Acidobacterium capsulatum TaxID=33075 RepID=A0A7V4XQ68_9BACT
MPFRANLCFAATLMLGLSGMTMSAHAQAPGNSSAAVEQRADHLLAEMSTQEKIGQLSQLFYFGPNVKIPGFDSGPSMETQIAKGEVGSLLFITDPATINRLQKIAVQDSPHHIPLIFGFDVIHGLRTIFPVPLAQAASWDPARVSRDQSIAAMEARSVGIDWAFAPMVDIARDPRWGRMVEGAGADPYLGAAMAAAQVRGFQGAYPGAPNHILACAKHFAGYGAAEGGRDYDASYISDSQLWNVYLPPFHAAVKAGVATLMSAYMDLNDVPATGNQWLLQDVLRKDWKFHGYVVSDANAVRNLQTHGFAKDQEDAAVRAFKAGVNMEMAIGQTAYDAELSKALQQGLITSQQLDDAVRPILEMKMRLGLFEHPYVDVARSEHVLADPAHRTAARIAAERSAVLLRNNDGLLPLHKGSYHNIAVIGPLADSQRDTLGPWTFDENLNEAVTVLQGLRNAFGASATITYAPGAQMHRKFPSMFDALDRGKKPPVWTPAQARQQMQQAVAIAQKSDLVVMVLGEHQNMSGEAASSDSLKLPGDQQQLLQSVAATGKPLVLILMNGRPLNIKWADRHVPAILDVWYPGSQGGNAVANLLLGKAVPGGKLPFDWPRDVGQVPIPYAHNLTHEPQNQARRYWDEASTPLYPFGYGLSYTTFAFSHLHIDKSIISRGEDVHVSVNVTNTGKLAGDEVAQLYTHQEYGNASRPVRELKGFERITLQPGQTETVQFTLGKEQLQYWSQALHGWTYDPSTYDVWVGGDSTASLHTKFAVTP